jgi:hypothetical protein
MAGPSQRGPRKIITHAVHTPKGQANVQVLRREHEHNHEVKAAGSGQDSVPFGIPVPL